MVLVFVFIFVIIVAASVRPISARPSSGARATGGARNATTATSLADCYIVVVVVIVIIFVVVVVIFVFFPFHVVAAAAFAAWFGGGGEKGLDGGCEGGRIGGLFSGHGGRLRSGLHGRVRLRACARLRIRLESRRYLRNRRGGWQCSGLISEHLRNHEVVVRDREDHAVAQVVGLRHRSRCREPVLSLVASSSPTAHHHIAGGRSGGRKWRSVRVVASIPVFSELLDARGDGVLVRREMGPLGGPHLEVLRTKAFYVRDVVSEIGLGLVFGLCTAVPDAVMSGVSSELRSHIRCRRFCRDSGRFRKLAVQ
jgi:hypothetical protein